MRQNFHRRVSVRKFTTRHSVRPKPFSYHFFKHFCLVEEFFTQQMHMFWPIVFNLIKGKNYEI